jgi:unsaturated rhamnogalacturonyl hydrolase
MRMLFHRIAPIVVTFWLGLHPVSVRAQDTVATKTILRLVAASVVHEGPLRFVDDASGREFVAPAEAPPDARLRLERPYADWRYWNGVLDLAMLRLADVVREAEYAEFVQKNIAFAFDNADYFKNRYNGEVKWSYPFRQFFVTEDLDDCGAMGASVLELQRRHPEKRLQAYIEQVSHHMLEKQLRLTDGTLARPEPQKGTVWADDLYMSVVFLARMGELNGDRRYFDDAARQVINFHRYLFDEAKGLMYHCYYSDVASPGVAFWGRANGWAMLAQVDLLDRLPQSHPAWAHLLELLRRQVVALAQYQGGEGLWHQLIDKNDSFLETSCSAMFTYAIARAVDQGYIEPRYGSVAHRGWEGVMTRIRADGKIEGICAGTGVGNDLVFYYHRPTPLNDPHGIGPVLLAGTEILILERKGL